MAIVIRIQYCVETLWKLWLKYLQYISAKCTNNANHIIIKCQRKRVPLTFIFSSLPAAWLVTVFNAQKQNKHTFAVQQRRAFHGSSDWSRNCIFMHNTDHNILSTQYIVLIFQKGNQFEGKFLIALCSWSCSSSLENIHNQHFHEVHIRSVMF